MANTTTQSYGMTPTLSSDFTTHAMALLRRRHNYSSLNSQSAKLDSSLKFKEIRRIKREIRDTFPDVSTSWYLINYKIQVLIIMFVDLSFSKTPVKCQWMILIYYIKNINFSFQTVGCEELIIIIRSCGNISSYTHARHFSVVPRSSN